MFKWYKEFIRTHYPPGERCPWYKGYIKDDFDKRCAVVCIIPFNIIFQIIFCLYYWLRLGIKDSIYFYEHQLKLREKNENLTNNN